MAGASRKASASDLQMISKASAQEMTYLQVIRN